MKKKPKYDWSQPSLFPEYDLHPASKELVGYKIVTNKNGKIQRNAIIRRTKDDFIQKSQAIWGDQYDYSETVYTTSKSPVTIRCKKHNHYFTVPFAQNHYIKPHGNVKPTGCDLCTLERTGIRPSRGPHHFRTLEERLRDEEEKARRKEERRLRAEQKMLEHGEERRQKRQQEQQAYIEKWKAKNLKEARFMERLQNRYPDMYDTHLVDYKDKDNRVTLICPIHGEFRITPRNLFGDSKHKAHGCWRCAGMIPPDRPSPMNADEFFQRMHKLYDGTELDFMTSEFKGMEKKVTAYCRKHGAITHPARYWLEGKGCEYCNGKFYPPDFLRLAREKHGDKFYYRGIKNITSAESEIMIHCKNPKHHWHKQRVSCHLFLGNGCAECYGQSNKWTPEERGRIFLEKAEKMFPGKFDYSEVHYVNKRTPVRIRCIEHDFWFSCKPNEHIHKRSAGCCPVCYESSGELAIRRWLIEHEIDFKKDWPIPNEDPTLPLQYLTIDFIAEYNRESIFIEFHGQQHYEETPHFYEGKSVRTFAVQQHRDRYLRQYCCDRKIRLIEIPYTDFDRIGEILSAILLEGKTDYSTYYVNNRQ